MGSERGAYIYKITGGWHKMRIARRASAGACGRINTLEGAALSGSGSGWCAARRRSRSLLASQPESWLRW
jgi:hypothetical protein